MGSMIDFSSMFAIPSLVLIWVTALFGLNDVRSLKFVFPPRTKDTVIDFLLGLSFFVMLVGSFFLLVTTLSGNHYIGFPGMIMLWGIAGVFAVVGKFAPWRKWIKKSHKENIS